MSSAFIRNTSRTAYIAETPRLHPACHLTFSPVLSHERDVLFAHNSRLKPLDKASNTATFLAKKILNWDLCDERGRAMPVTAQSLLDMQPVLQDRMYSILWGLDGGDEDPEAPPAPEETSTRLEEQLFGKEHGLVLGQAAEVLDEKKS